MAAMAWLAADLMQHSAWGAFAVVVLLLGSNRFFFPTKYELDSQGITARFPLRTVRYRWEELRRFVYDDAGGFLSPRARRSFLDEHRGISLLFGQEEIGDKAERIIQEIRRRLPANAIIRDVTKKTDRMAGVEAQRSPQQSLEANSLSREGSP